MKTTFIRKAKIQSKATQNNSTRTLSDSSDADCTCEILLDTSLSKVNDSDCTCSDCLEANLQAFNQFKQNQPLETEERRQLQQRSYSTKNKIGISNNRKNYLKNNQLPSNLERNKSENKVTFQQKTTVKRFNQKQYLPESQVKFNLNQIQKEEKIQDEGLEDFIKITRYRTKRYIEERKKLENEQQHERDKLKQKIKQNLEMLKYTVNIIKDKQKEGAHQKQQEKGTHKYKWNHQPFLCECNENQCKNSEIDCCAFRGRGHKCQALKIDTNLQKIFGNQFVVKRDQILQEQKHNRLNQIKKKEQQKCPDPCPNHHMRTSLKKIEKIEAFIMKKAEEIKSLKQKQKIEKQQQQKMKVAKLRAIDLKCKKIVAKSKKIDDNVSRTSFQLSIDHFSTFSDLRQQHQIRMEEKQRKRNVNTVLNKGGKALESAIYQNLEEDLEDYKPKLQSNIKQSKKDTNQINFHNKNENNLEQAEKIEYCQKIVREAKVRSPKNIDIHSKQQKQPTKIDKLQNQEVQKGKKKASDLKKEEKRRKEIQIQIQRKKKQLLTEYQKRNTLLGKEDVKNKKIREDYERKIKRI